jgi:hypothetical protein
MTMILASDGRKETALSRDLVQLLVKVDEALRANGMQMQIVCENCHANGHPAPYAQAGNQRFSSEFKLTCPCTVRTAHLGH